MSSKNTILMPRESGRFIANLATHVTIKTEGINKLASMIVENLKNQESNNEKCLNYDILLDPKDPKVIDLIFFINTLNFCFWNNTNNLKWRVNGESGYFALCAAIKRATEKGIPITNSTFLSKITKNELHDILKGDAKGSEIPLLDERVKNLNEVGRVLLEKFNGTFVECVKSCNNSAEQLLKLVVKNFKCFRDEANYRDHRVCFYKRAQILVGDLWNCFGGKGLCAFDDIDYITMFPDYRVPQVLVYYEALQYSNELMNKLQSQKNLEVGCDEEIEIRGCSIEAVERISAQVKVLVHEDPSLNLCKSDYNAIRIDYFLWEYRRKHAKELESIPYHKVLTIFY